MKEKKAEEVFLIIFETIRNNIYPRLSFNEKEINILESSSLIKRIISVEKINYSDIDIRSKISEALASVRY